MGILHSTPVQSESHTRLDTHGPSLPVRRRRLNWWEVLKLGAVTASVGALQWLKLYFLMLEDRETQLRRQRRRGHHLTEEEEAAQKGFAASLSPESRLAVIGMIDHVMTPLLVDQWRLGLVKVLLDPEEGPVLPEGDPDTRKALLASIQTYQAERDARPTFRAGHVPARYSPAGPSSSSRPSHMVRARHDSKPAGKAEPAKVRGQQQAGPSAVLAEHQPSSAAVAPSAPPLDPTDHHPSAPPLFDDWQVVDASAEDIPALPEECGVCLDAKVEVEIDACGHQLCSECAKAICCLEGRAPQCPFCRGAMIGVRAL